MLGVEPACERLLKRSGLAPVPNAAHLALAQLEQYWPGASLLVTQNVDDLHDRAGHTRHIATHGGLLQSVCTHCGDQRACRVNLSTDHTCPAFGTASGLRAAVVWFGEMPQGLDQIATALRACDVFISIGTSGQVYPATGFAAEAQHAGAITVELNLKLTGGAFDHAVAGPATALVPALVQRLMGR